LTRGVQDQGMDLISVVLGIAMFAILYVLIVGIDRI
jgi:hypothetical protein